MECDTLPWIVTGLCTVQVQRIQAAPTLPIRLVQTHYFLSPREGGLTQLVRCLQHCTVLDDLGTMGVEQVLVAQQSSTDALEKARRSFYYYSVPCCCIPVLWWYINTCTLPCGSKRSRGDCQVQRCLTSGVHVQYIATTEQTEMKRISLKLSSLSKQCYTVTVGVLGSVQCTLMPLVFALCRFKDSR